MIDFTKIAIEKDPAILDGNIDMVNYIFETKHSIHKINTLYCSYEHEYSLKSAARNLGLFKRKTPVIIKIKIKYLKNYGKANKRNKDGNQSNPNT